MREGGTEEEWRGREESKGYTYILPETTPLSSAQVLRMLQTERLSRPTQATLQPLGLHEPLSTPYAAGRRRVHQSVGQGL